jgi:hypothetical protein
MEFKMVTAPARPLTHSYDPDKNPFELVDSPSGPMERWRADALLVGETSALTELIKQVHNDSVSVHARYDAREAELNARADALDERERQIGVMAAQVADLAGQLSVRWDKLQKTRADQEREPIAHPPDNQGKLPDSIPGKGSGDPSSPSQLPEPSLEVEDDAIPGKGSGDDRSGDSLRLKHSIAMDQAEFPEGEQLPTPPEFKAPAGDELDHED